LNLRKAKFLGKNEKISLTLDTPRYIIVGHVKLSDEVECGYAPWKTGDGGNFYGVCYGYDQAASFI